MGVYSIRHLTERCNGWMACYSQTFTKTFYVINFVCCALWMLTYKKKNVQSKLKQVMFPVDHDMCAVHNFRLVVVSG